MLISDELVQAPIRGEGRERILDEARLLFLNKGFAATSMQEIADAVGLTKPALYYHFKDKQDLLLAVIGREMKEGWDIFVQLLSSYESLEDRLENATILFFTRVKGDMGRLMSDMHRVLPAERVREFKCQNPMPVDMIAQMLEGGKTRGEIADTEDTAVLARLFTCMLFGQLAMQNSEEIQEIDPDAMGKTVTRVFLNGVAQRQT